jgi:asparagine synthase (glutamine-hydrolysing)
MELARQAGVTVLLDGQGADEQLAGYLPPSFGGRFASLFRGRRFGLMTEEMAAYRRRHGSGLRAARFLATTLLPPWIWTELKARQGGAQGLLREGLWQRHFDSFLLPDDSPFASPLKTELFRQITRTSLPSLLRFGDRSSMAFSRETRLPFLDHRLVTLSFQMPEHLLVSDGITKVVLRRAMRDVLPAAVVGRMDKLGFATPEDQWFRGPLRGWFESVLTEAVRSELVVSSQVWALWRRFLAGRGTLGPLWRVANLHLWRARFAV